MKLKKALSITLASLMLALQLPVAALAEEVPVDPAATTQTTTTEPTQSTVPAPSTTTEPTPTQPVVTQGPTKPTGADAPQYVFNPETGMWESDKYIWNPKTNQTTPKYDPGYYYNPQTGRWDTTQYQYRPETKTYEPVVVSAAAAPNAATVGTDLKASQPASLMDVLAGLLGGTLSNSNTGPNSTNTVVANTNNTGFFDLFSKAVVNNNLNSQATTGNATVSGNTNGGSATTGAAQVVANLFNLLNSAWSWSTGGLSTFMANMFGNQTGDLLLNPVSSGGCGVNVATCGGQLGSLPGSASNSTTGPNSTNTINAGTDNAVTVNSQANGEINNNLNLLAQSGNAGVTGNTNAGNATSGDASVNVNILNLINSAIGAGESFFGVVNIFGNLTGDILFPQGFLDSIAAASGTGVAGPGATNQNTGPNSNNQINTGSNSSTNVNNVANSGINNNINSAAQTGNANVSGNTTAGNATTGNANTNTNVFNFAGDLSSDNAVLVLVNVLGHWVGAILNLPQTGNSQAALLTGGETALTNQNTGPNSNNQINASSNSSTNINNTSNGTINNNINAGAISGDADVTGNTNAGNATTGDASVATNVANFVGSTLNLKKWFGVLMINVFGDWNGSVAIDTPAGSKVSQTTNAPTATNSSAQVKTSTASSSKSTGSGGDIKGSNQNTTKVAASNNTKTGSEQHVLGSQKTAQSPSGSAPIAIMAVAAAVLLLLSGMIAGFDKKLGHKA